MNDLQKLQQEYKDQYEAGEITFEELQQKLEDSYYDFNND
jgi:hypothetical protein